MTDITAQLVDTGRDTVERFNPFPGLRPFTIEESHLFFGREGQCDEIRQFPMNQWKR